jgi:hypothetical protein
MNNREYFTIIYDGESLNSHEFDVRELAPALLGVADLLEEANKVINGTKAKVQINVKGNFKSGSFPIDFSIVQDIVEQLTNLFNNPQVQEAVTLLSFLGFTVKDGGIGVLHLIKWIGGRKIKQITKNSNGNKVTILLDDEDKIEVENEVVNLFSSVKIRQSLETTIFKPLSREGIGVFKVKHKNTEIEINKTEAELFATPTLEDEIINDNVLEKSLQLLTVNFVDGNKWRFSDGNSTFFAELKDEEFVRQVRSGTTSFAIDDIFKVKIREVQKLTAMGMRTEVEILEVLEHRTNQRSLQLPLISNE